MGHYKIIAAILIWSSLGIFIRKIDLPNQAIVYYTSVIAGVIQFTILLSTGLLRREKKKAESGKGAVYLLLAPVCFIANTMLFYFAFRNTTIANAVLTHYTAPIFVAVLAPIVLKEKISKLTWMAIALSSFGLWFILGSKGGGIANLSSNRETLGIIAGALSGLAYACLIIVIRRVAPIYSALFITFVQNGIVALILLPFVYTVPLTFDMLPYLVTLGIVHSTIAPLLYVQGLQSVRANEAAILGYFEPVGATVLAYIFFSEVPGAPALLGGALILYSGYIIIRNRTA
jgi:drug/metabolite transporter (DMT)-like permease